MACYLVYDPLLAFEPFLIQHDLKTTFAIEIEVCKDPSAFEQKLNDQYDAFILFEKDHFKEALSLLDKIQSHPTVFFVTEHRTASSFKRLKKEFGVDFVLQTPMLKEEVSALLRRLKQAPLKAEEGLPPELVAKYQESIFHKIERIEELVQQSKESLDKLKELRNEVHKIAGSASSYGFSEASMSCKTHELTLMEAVKSGVLSEGIDKQNAIFLRKLRLAFQHISVETKQEKRVASSKPHKETTQNVLLLISSDLPLVQTFQRLAERFHVPIVVESNPRKVQEKFKTEPFDASGVIVEEYYPFTAVTGLRLIEELKEKGPEARFGIISNTEEVIKRIEWTEKGIQWVLKKPITENNILQVFQQMERTLTFQNTRALIVDDDEDVGLIEKQLLGQMEIQAVFLKDERNLLRTLEEFAPHLLLLDVNLPHFNGQKLLKMLRADMRFQRMIIVLVTSFKQEIQEDQVYQQNCDSIIYKPLNPVYFISRIGNLLSRRMAVGLRTVVDPTTALYEKAFYIQRVAGRLPHVRNQKGAFVLLEVDFWDQVSQTLSAIEKKQIVILIANSIRQNFAGKTIYGYMGVSQFSIFFEGYSGGEVEFFMESYLSDMRKMLWLSGREDLRFTISIGIVLFETTEAKIDVVLGATEETLKKAQEAGGKQIAICRLGESTAVSTQTRRVILVDDDVELTDVIAYMFRNQGIQVDVFHTGADAVDFFAKLESVDRNVLFILDRMLPDRDGLTLLRMIKEKFPGRVKAIFLTSLASEKDILEGLQMGAVDYVVKPFSISVLVQKAIALLNR